MRYLIGDNSGLLFHVSSGQLLSEGRFTHPRRKLDTFVIIICVKGKLHITQDDQRRTLTENQYIILFAGHEHFGFKESEGELSYYWCHFRFSGDKYDIINTGALDRIFDAKSPLASTAAGERHFSGYYLLPEYGDISANYRAIQIFRQLLDLARKDCYSDMLPNCCLSLLAMEISQEFIETRFRRRGDVHPEFNPRLEKIIEWIRVNYNRQFSVEAVARKFSYNGDYLSTAFRRYTGVPLMKYISMVRISNAKKLLLNTPDGIKDIAWQVGFDDEKTFMKRFKQLEDMTPTTYRNAFNRTKIVK